MNRVPTARVDDAAGWPTQVSVDLDAVADNVRVLRAHAPGAELMAVVKANAYGHGLLPCARAALRGGATWLATAQLPEALELRAAGVSAPLLCWLYAPGADFAAAVDARVDLGASAPWTLREIAAAARARGVSARVHLKVDTGLARNGAYGADWPRLLDEAARWQAEGSVQVVGVFSHFAYADAPNHPTVRAQQERFAEAVRDCERARLPLEVRHLANSAATLTNPSAAFDLVRPGLSVYGLSPAPDLGDSAWFGLRPAMTVTARVCLVKSIPAGQGVSYGHEYTPAVDTQVALLPVGYADGLPRNATNVGPVLVGGRGLTISGRVCMDQVVVDIGREASVKEGDVATLFGPGDQGEPTAQDWARATGTISYEIVTRVAPRIARVYTGEQ